jgi:hypothetical protein
VGQVVEVVILNQPVLSHRYRDGLLDGILDATARAPEAPSVTNAIDDLIDVDRAFDGNHLLRQLREDARGRIVQIA